MTSCFDVDRSDLSVSRWAEVPVPTEHAGGAGLVELEVEGFAFTANNITYAVAGDMLDYWGFFPAEMPWGRVPCMGYGRVVASAVDGIEVGSRYYGWYPMTDRVVISATATSGGFRDDGEHRANHAPVYRTFERLDDSSGDADDDGLTERGHRRLLLRGLFATSWLVDDFLASNDDFGAERVIITSASSKTSIALAHSVHARGEGRPSTVGLTSPRNREFVESLGWYDEVVEYGDLDGDDWPIDRDTPSVIVDMAGDQPLLGKLHTGLGALKHSARVGMTHWDAVDAVELPAPAPEFFFAPSQIQVRAADWGPEVLNQRLLDAVNGFIDDSFDWMTVEVCTGQDAVADLYERTRNGEVSPATGQIGVVAAGGGE